MDLASGNEYLATSGLSNYEQPFPPVGRANAISEVTPAKKITFFKSGDPQFSGVKMAINQRSFKSINALMDDLSNRVPLPFGVRTITTPRETHCVNRVEQLEDGGSYLCSDKKYVQPIGAGAPGRRKIPRRPSLPLSTRRPEPPEGQKEDFSVTHSHQAAKIRKKITLVKNVDPTVQHLIVLNRRNSRNFKTFLEDVSELLQCSVKKLYTLDGKRIDSMQMVLHSPNVLICVGRETFKPILMDNLRKSSSEQLPGLGLRSHPSIASESVDSKKNVSFGLKAKKSVIHPRSASSNRTRFSLSSEKSYANGLNMSPGNSRCASFSKPKEGDPAHSLVNDDIEKRVHVNKDGSLSVEMKVRFRLLNDETLQWSTQIKKSRAPSKLMDDPLCLYEEEEDRMECRQAMNPEAFSETDESFYPCDADSYSSKPNEAEDEEPYCHNCGKQCQDYDIWKNPMLASRQGDTSLTNGWQSRSSGSSASSHRRLMCKKKTSIDSIQTTSSEEYTERFVQESSCYSEVVEHCDSQVECCTVSQCRSQSGLSTATSNIRAPQHRAHGIRNKSQSSASVASNSSTQNNQEAQSPVEVTSQMSDLKSKRTSSDWIEPSTAHQSKSASNVTDHDRQDSYISDSSRRIKRTMHKTYGVYSKSLSFSHCLSKTDVNELVTGSPLANSISCDCHKRSSTKTDCSSMSIHSCGNINKTLEEKEKRDNKCMLTSLSLRSMLSESEKWSTEGSTHSRGCEKGRNTQGNKSEGGGSDELNETCARQQSQMQTAHFESASTHALNEERISASGASSPSICMDPQPPQSGRSISQHHRNRNKFASGSSLSMSNLKEGEENTKASFSSLISRPSSKSESLSSKYNCVSKPGLQSTSSGVSSNSEINNDAAEVCSTRGDSQSKSSIAHSSNRGKRKKKACHAKHCKRSSVSETDSSISMHSPSPPKGKPNNNRSRTEKLRHSSSIGSVHNLEEEKAAHNHSSPSTSTSQSITSKGNPENKPNPGQARKDNNNADQNVMHTRRKSSVSSCKQKAKLGVGGTSAPLREGIDIMPSALPNVTAEEVVHEWLRNIPAETIAVECEADHQPLAETELETLNNDIGQETMSAEEEFEEGIEKENSDLMMERTINLETAINADNKLKSEGISTQENLSDNCTEGGDRKKDEASPYRYAPSGDTKKRALPCTVHASAQIMKALLQSPNGSTIDRSNSLPEVSPAMGRKLTNSAKVLITCLVGLKLLDEETLDPTGKIEGSNNNRYVELLNVFQSLWAEGPVNADTEWAKVDRSAKYMPTTHAELPNNRSGDAVPTPASSSGVDVNSGSGGSGEGSMAGTGDSTLMPGKTGECKLLHTPSSIDSIAHDKDPELNSPKAFNEKGLYGRSASSSSSMGKLKEEISSGGNSSRTTSPNNLADTIVQTEEQCIGCETDLSDVDENMKERKVDKSVSNHEAGAAEHEIASPLTTEENVDFNREELLCATITDWVTDNTVKPGSNHENEFAANVSKSHDTTESNSQSDCQSTVYFISESNENNDSFAKKQSFITDPAWILKLLKKIEQEFMTHYVDAMHEFKIRWNLEDNQQLDEMITELKYEVEKRIQKSVENELGKIQSRAGRMVPRPPNEKSRQWPAQPTEQRRKRLQTMRNRSAVNQWNVGQNKQVLSNDLSLETDQEDLTFSASLADEISADDEYCPCETCVRKKLALRPPKANTVSANAPIVRAFDLREILRMKKEPTGVISASPCSSIKEYQGSSAVHGDCPDVTKTETNQASEANENIITVHCEHGNTEKVEIENHEQNDDQNSNLQVEENICSALNSENKEGWEDQKQHEEKNTQMANHKPKDNQSEPESNDELGGEIVDHEEPEVDHKEDPEDTDTAEETTSGLLVEEADSTENGGEDQVKEEENDADDKEAGGEEDNELSFVEETNEDTADVESEVKMCELENTVFESEQTTDAVAPNNQTMEPPIEINEQNEIFKEAAPHNETHEPVEGGEDKNNEPSAADIGGSTTEEIIGDLLDNVERVHAEDVGRCSIEVTDDEGTSEEKGGGPVEETDGIAEEEINDVLVEDMDGSLAEEKDIDATDKINGGPDKDLTGGASNEEDECSAGEHDDGPAQSTPECTEQDKDICPDDEADVTQTEENTGAEDKDGGPPEEVGPAEDTDCCTAENIGEATEEDDTGTAEDVDSGPLDDVCKEAKEGDHCPKKEIDSGQTDDTGDPSCDIDGAAEDNGNTSEEMCNGQSDYMNEAANYDVGPAEETDSGPRHDMGDPSDDIDGAAEEEGSPTEEICNGPSNDMGAAIEEDASAADKIDSVPEDDTDGPSDDNDGAAEEDGSAEDNVCSSPLDDMGEATGEDVVAMEEFDSGPTGDLGAPSDDIDGDAREDGSPSDVIRNCPSDDIGEEAEKDVGLAEETDSGPSDAMGGAAEEEVCGQVEDIDTAPSEEINGAAEEVDDVPSEESSGGQTEDKVDEIPIEEGNGSPPVEMNGSPEPEKDSSKVCQDLENGNGSSGHGDSDSSGSKPVQMYPDSSSEEEDRGSERTSPVVASNGFCSLKKTEKLHGHSIELDDLDF
ncbi:retinitis pigmentosa 1-like 1 protein [Ambystoma mexicanum]|uniref:retinitis pigmentosa 1-like 1 protein n=1 Tax=Ambystoma mexicanum TaxID=8296 RepID=UPI0037E96C9A